MGVIPASEFTGRLETLDHAEFVEFVALLWEGSGWEVTTETPVVVVRKENHTERLLVLQPRRFVQFRRAPAGDTPVDRVVSPRIVGSGDDLPRGTPDVPVVDGEDLRQRLLYGLDGETAETLSEDVLGVTPRGDEWSTTDGPTRDRWKTVFRAGDDESAPFSRRAMLGLVGAGALGGMGVAVRSRLGDGGEETFDDEPPPVPDVEDEPDVAFEFDHDETILSIRHGGGSVIDAEDVVIRGEGFEGAPELRWSESAGYTTGSSVSPGDTLELPFRADGSVELVWTGTDPGVALATFDEPESDSGPGLAGMSQLSLEFSYGRRLLSIRQTGGKAVDPSKLYIRGLGFDGAPEHRWSDSLEPDEAVVAEGDDISLGAREDVVVSVYWSTGDRSTLVDQYYGPGRPHGPSLDGTPAFSIDAANTGYAGDIIGPSDDVQAIWSFETDGRVLSSPAVRNGIVYAGSYDGNVYALDGIDGRELWRYDTGDNIDLSSPTVFDGVVYIGNEAGTLTALGARTGDLRWTFRKFDRISISPTVVERPERGTTIYVSGEGTGDTGLYAIDADEGSDRWYAGIGDASNSAPAVYGDTVYVGSMDGVVYAIDTLDGSQRWGTTPVERGVSITSTPAVADSVVYVGTMNGTVHALDAESGSEQWSFDGGGRILSSPAVARDNDGETRTVFVATTAGNLFAIDARNGTEKWRFETGETIASSPVVDGSNQPVRETADDGNDEDTGEESSVQTVYFGSFDRHVYAVDTSDGSERWSYETGEPIVASPALAQGVVYVGSGDGSIYAVTNPIPFTIGNEYEDQVDL